jgi:hypothetical protein
MASFEPHGDTGIEVHGQILILRPHGHFNTEEVARILERINALLPKFAGLPWGIVYSLESTTLLTPEAESLGTAASPLLTASGLAGLAIVLRGVEKSALVETQVRRIYSNTQCPIKVFDNERPAEDWMRGLLARR